MRTIAFILLCCWMDMDTGECLEDHIGTESTLTDKVLDKLPVKKCDSIMVSRLPLRNIGKSTIYFNSVNDLIALMEDEEFVLTLSSMSCLILVSNSNSDPMARIHSAETGCLYIFQLPQTVLPSCAVQNSNFG